MQFLQIPFLGIPVCDITWWHWLLAMLVPFLLGYLVRYFLNSRFKAKISALESEKAELEAGLKKAKSLKAAAAPVVVSADKGELNSLKDKVRDLEAHNAKLKADITEALAVKQQFAGVNIDKLNNRIAELEGIEAKLTGDLSSQRSLNASLTANTGDLDALKAKLGGAQDEIIRLTAQVNTLKADLGGITRENDNINGLRSDIRDLSGKVGALTVENERLKQQLATPPPADNSALDAAKAQLAAAEAAAGGLKAKVAELEAANSSLQATAATAAAGSEDAAKAAAELADTKAKLADAGIEAGNLRLRLEQLTAEAGSLKAQAEGCGAENAELKAKLAALEAAHETSKTAFAAAAPIAAAEPVKPDDLKIVEGIGPKIEELFNAAGIYTFKQLYSTPVEQLKQILTDAGPRFQIHDPATWPEQARLADEGKMDELKALQDRLNAGRE